MDRDRNRDSARPSIRGVGSRIGVVAVAIVVALAHDTRAGVAGAPRLTSPIAPLGDERYVEDAEFALDALERECGHFFELKDIDWKAVRKEILAEAREVEDDLGHFWVMNKLLARLRDGHASVRLRDPTKDLQPMAGESFTGCGLFLCRIGKKWYVKRAWNAAGGAGIETGMELLTVDGRKVADWWEERKAFWCDRVSFSTDQQAEAWMCHQGLIAPKGTRREFELKDAKNRKKKRTVIYERATYAPHGPLFLATSEGDKDVSWTTLTADHGARKPAKSKKDARYGYVHIRRCPGDLPERVDRALADLGDVDGIILDWRGNSGGGFDHDALFGRFVPAGETLSFGKRYGSAGENPYAGPVVVLVDATVRSAGETGSGIFKEDGRALMLGTSPTAGMSASKKEIELPSGLFALYVAVASNKGRFQGGRGIEGIGVVPHEQFEYEVDDLREERDTLLQVALNRLEKGGWKEVPYRPERYGWKH